MCSVKHSKYHKRSKHIDVRYHFIRENFKNKEIDAKFVFSTDQLANIFIKHLACYRLPFFRNKIIVKSLNSSKYC